VSGVRKILLLFILVAGAVLGLCILAVFLIKRHKKTELEYQALYLGSKAAPVQGQAPILSYGHHPLLEDIKMPLKSGLEESEAESASRVSNSSDSSLWGGHLTAV
jgi:hypothetical protein